MSALQATTALRSTRSLSRLPVRDNRASAALKTLSSLLKHHQASHPCEPLYPLYWTKNGLNGYKLTCQFYGQEVVLEKLTRPPRDFIGHLIGPVREVRESEVALKVLEEEFGGQDETFINEAAPLALHSTCRDGYARPFFWDKESNCVTANLREGFSISLQGSNLVEAAIWLPRFARQIRQNLSNVKEGVSSVWVSIEQGEEFSIAASPLHIWCQVPDYRHAPFQTINDLPGQTLSQAIKNRR